MLDAVTLYADSPAEFAARYAVGVIAWAFVVGLIPGRKHYAHLLETFIWPVSAAASLGGVVRGIVAGTVEGLRG